MIRMNGKRGVMTISDRCSGFRVLEHVDLERLLRLFLVICSP